MVTGFFCAVTQEDQDKIDEEDEREAVQNLVQTWLERLQLISVIVSKAMFYNALQKYRSMSNLQTTFFASTESGMLGKSLPSSGNTLSTVGQVTNICFMCALLVHAHACRFVYYFQLAMTINFHLQLLYLFLVHSFSSAINSKLPNITRRKLNMRWSIHRHPSRVTQKK